MNRNITQSSNEVELINLGVLKEFRGLKLGSTLVNHAIASASRKTQKECGSILVA